MNASMSERFQRARRDPELAVLEGFHAVKHAIRFRAELVEVVATEPDQVAALTRELAPDLLDTLPQLTAAISSELFASLAPHAPRTGMLAIARRPSVDLDAVLTGDLSAPVVLLEDPRNMANAGACVRVAAGAGAAALLSTGRNDPWHPAALRGAAGLHFALPVIHTEKLPRSDRPLLAIDPGGQDLRTTDLPPGAILAFGTERQGLSDELLAGADARLRIPMIDGVSSLNLATAVAAVLYGWRFGAGGGGTQARA